MTPTPLLVITGPPGAGKSTVSRLVAGRLHVDGASGPTVLVQGDAFFGFLAAGVIPPWEPASAAQNEVVVDATAAATARFVAAGWPTVFDGIIGPWFLDRFLAGVGVDEVDYAILLPPVERCLARVADRADHSFRDASATRKMYDEFRTAARPPGHCPGQVLDNGAEDPADTAASIVAAREAGLLRHRR